MSAFNNMQKKCSRFAWVSLKSEVKIIQSWRFSQQSCHNNCFIPPKLENVQGFRTYRYFGISCKLSTESRDKYDRYVVGMYVLHQWLSSQPLSDPGQTSWCRGLFHNSASCYNREQEVRIGSSYTQKQDRDHMFRAFLHPRSNTGSRPMIQDPPVSNQTCRAKYPLIFFSIWVPKTSV